MLQSATNHTGQFTDMSIGYSGRNNDASFVFEESALCTAMGAGAFVSHKPMIRLGEQSHEPQELDSSHLG